MEKPNIIIMFADNQGYGDLGCYGSTVHRTPHIDRMAEEGIRLTSFYSTSGVCTPSRASLMTGCYPRRVNMHESGDGRWVLFPEDKKGLHPDEITLARLLKNQGYATACFGKWHLGDQPAFLPTRHGFDEYFGIPYSEDMVPNERFPDRPPLPLMRQETVVEAPVDRAYLTKRYTEESIRFIEEQKNGPFFLYLPHAMPGSTAHPFASPRFAGKSANGKYGDSIEELDWSAGEILAALKRLNLDDRTLVMWISDNGAVKRDPQQGSNAPLSGWGYDTTEGGQRVPFVARWPGVIPQGAVSDEVATMMDLLPTCTPLAGTKPPEDRVIDGFDIMPLLTGDTSMKSQYDEAGFFYYHWRQLQAVRSGPWKLYLPLEEKLLNLRGDTVRTDAVLYDVRNDLGEKAELSAQHPDVVGRLLGLADLAREELGDDEHQGKGQRPGGWVENPTPRLLET